MRDYYSINGHPWEGRKHSLDSKEKMSIARKGRFCGKEHPNYGKKMSLSNKIKISQANTGRAPWNKGHKKESPTKIVKTKEEISLSLSKAQIKRYTKSGKPRTLPVINLETKTIYSSLEEASITNKLTIRDITRVCSGKRKTAGGFHWAYYSD